MFATILENRATTASTRHGRRAARSRPITEGEARYLRAILEAQTPNSIPVTGKQVFVTRGCRCYAPLGHPRIAERLVAAGLVQVPCRARYDYLGDLVIDGAVSVTQAGRKALRTGRIALA